MGIGGRGGGSRNSQISVCGGRMNNQSAMELHENSRFLLSVIKQNGCFDPYTPTIYQKRNGYQGAISSAGKNEKGKENGAPGHNFTLYTSVIAY